MSFLLYMASEQTIYNILQGEIPSTIDISNTFTISLDGTDLSSSFIAGTTITPQGLIDKLNNDLGLGNELILGEDSYVNLQKLQELYPGLEMLNSSRNSDINNRIATIDTSFVSVNISLDSINAKIASINQLITNTPFFTLFNHINGSRIQLIITGTISSDNYTNNIDKTNIKYIVINKLVTDISSNCFQGCNNLSRIIFDASSVLTSIGSNAFQDSSLNSITIPASVTSIDGVAFDGCSSLTSILVPSGITYGIYTFQSTDALSNVFFYNKTNKKFYIGVKTDNSITQGSTEITTTSTPTTLDQMAAYFGDDAAAGKAYIGSLGYTTW